MFSVFLFIPISFYRENGLLLFFICHFIGFSSYPGIGREVNGSRRWLDLGFMNMQPSEVAKIFVPIYLCGYCLRRKEQLESSWRGFLKPIILHL